MSVSGWAFLEALAPTLPWVALEEYAAELERWNRAIRLVGPKEREGIRFQIMDALAPFLLCVPRFPLLDIGSGAGLPGLALALAFASTADSRPRRVVCMEPLGKRVSFLRHMVRHLGLEGVEVVAERAEEALAQRPDLRGVFATVTARAVAETAGVLGMAGPYLAPGGSVILPRGDESPATPEGWRLEKYLAYGGPPGVGPRRVHVYVAAD